MNKNKKKMKSILLKQYFIEEKKRDKVREVLSQNCVINEQVINLFKHVNLYKRKRSALFCQVAGGTRMNGRWEL